MVFIESILYGLIYGLSEFLPVSSKAHQTLMQYLFWPDTGDSLQNLLVHIGLLLAIFISCRDILLRIMRQQRTVSGRRRRKVRSLDSQSLYDLRLLKTATIPMLIGLSLSFLTKNWGTSLLPLVTFGILNGVFLLIADHSRHGNRDSRSMTGLDGIVMGIIGSLSAFPGISRTGVISAYATIRGADGQNSANWAVLLGIPALVFGVFFDIYCMFSAGVSAVTVPIIAAYCLSGVAAFIGGYLGISICRIVLNHSGFSGFAYYSFGTALLSFVLYLIT